MSTAKIASLQNQNIQLRQEKAQLNREIEQLRSEAEKKGRDHLSAVGIIQGKDREVKLLKGVLEDRDKKMQVAHEELGACKSHGTSLQRLLDGERAARESLERRVRELEEEVGRLRQVARNHQEFRAQAPVASRLGLRGQGQYWQGSAAPGGSHGGPSGAMPLPYQPVAPTPVAMPHGFGAPAPPFVPGMGPVPAPSSGLFPPLSAFSSMNLGARRGPAAPGTPIGTLTQAPTPTPAPSFGQATHQAPSASALALSAPQPTVGPLVLRSEGFVPELRTNEDMLAELRELFADIVRFCQQTVRPEYTSAEAVPAEWLAAAAHLGPEPMLRDVLANGATRHLVPARLIIEAVVASALDPALLETFPEPRMRDQLATLRADLASPATAANPAQRRALVQLRAETVQQMRRSAAYADWMRSATAASGSGTRRLNQAVAFLRFAPPDRRHPPPRGVFELWSRASRLCAPLLARPQAALAFEFPGTGVRFVGRSMRSVDPATQGLFAEEVQREGRRVTLCVAPVVSVVEEGREPVGSWVAVQAEVLVR